MSVKRQHGQVVHSDGRNIISNIILVCEEEKRLNAPVESFSKPLDRAALYSNTSVSTVKRIKKEYRDSSTSDRVKEVKLSTPGKHRKKVSFRKCDDFDQQIIRRTISNFYLEDKPRVPSTKKLLGVLERDINFPYGREKLRQLLHYMGYSWQKCGTRRKLLLERPENVAWRKRYIEDIRQYRNEKRNIYYIDETWIDNNLTFKKCWQGKGLEGIIVDNSAKNRLILVHACSENGMLNGAELLYRANISTGDYHGQMNSELFLKWITTQLIPSLPLNSVIVMDNAPYHTKAVDRVPNKYSTKAVMKEWLTRHQISFTEKMLKYELYNLIELNKPKEKKYVIDEAIRAAGHQVLRLPPYMCELNIIEMAWCKIKTKAREANITGDLCLQKLQEVAHEAIASVTADDTKGFVKHVISLENEYFKNDPIIEDKVDEIIVTFGNDSESEDDLFSESDKEDEFDDLAEPLD